jgi:hypothetical protein
MLPLASGRPPARAEAAFWPPCPCQLNLADSEAPQPGRLLLAAGHVSAAAETRRPFGSAPAVRHCR